MHKINPLVLFGLLIVAPGCSKNSPAPTTAVFHPQFVFNSSGELLLAWCEEHESGANLFLASGDDKNQVSNRVGVNHLAGMVNSSSFDELRPSIAVAAGGLLAIGFTDKNWDVRVAISRDGGQTFESAIKLNQDTTHAMQSFVSVAFDSEGSLHGVWIDPREAPPRQEEPCDLYYAHLQNGNAGEQNLTAGQIASVCGCCRPCLAYGNDGRFEVLFRNTDAAGYRDIYRVAKSSAGEFSHPARIGPALWKIAGCPAAGPVAVNGWTLWNDGSTGAMRLLALADSKELPETVLRSDETWAINGSPRPVKTQDQSGALVLVPGTPTGKIMRLENNSWKMAIADIPEWCRDAALHNGELRLLGTTEGKLEMEIRPISL